MDAGSYSGPSEDQFGPVPLGTKDGGTSMRPPALGSSFYYPRPVQSHLHMVLHGGESRPALSSDELPAMKEMFYG